MIEFRWVTQVLSGPWHATHNMALLNALQHGQAFVNRGKGRIITLQAFASIEERDTDRKVAQA